LTDPDKNKKRAPIRQRQNTTSVTGRPESKTNAPIEPEINIARLICQTPFEITHHPPPD
jgi:hypothetical protein